MGEFTSLTEDIMNLMERETEQTRKMQIKGKLVTLEPEGEAVIVGDVHGDLESLLYILNDSNFIEEAQKDKDVLLIFLGDYGDRGLYSAEVYYIVLQLKRRFPENVVLMRGNHEGPEDLIAEPHDLPIQFRQRFGNQGEAAYSCVRKLFNQLYSAVLVENRYVLIHGGFPTTARSFDDVAYAHEKHPEKPFLEEMLWNDPKESIKGACVSPRGAGRLFGSDVTSAFLEVFKVKVLIRGHEPSSEGFGLNHVGRVLTLFSRKGPPYYNEHGAYLRIDLSFEIGSAEELLRWVHVF